VTLYAKNAIARRHEIGSPPTSWARSCEASRRTTRATGPVDAVPPGTVGTVGEQADRQNPPQAAHAVHQMAPTESSILSERSTNTTAAQTSTPATPPISTAAGDHEAPRRGDGDESGERPVREASRGRGLPYLRHTYSIA